MSGVRTKNQGKDKEPGRFRGVQNWIGMPGTPIEKAIFVPPEPVIVEEYMQKLIEFIENDYIDNVVQLAIFHAQFEIIHPFMDDNGRIGRLLIPLFLYSKKLLSRPIFYVSEYLENNRKQYYEKLQGVSQSGDWQSWIEFFLKAVVFQADKNIDRAIKILDLYEKLKTKFINVTNSRFAVPLLDCFFTKPVIDSATAFKLAKIRNRTTGNALLKKLSKANLIFLLKEGKGAKPIDLYFT